MYVMSTVFWSDAAYMRSSPVRPCVVGIQSRRSGICPSVSCDSCSRNIAFSLCSKEFGSACAFDLSFRNVNVRTESASGSDRLLVSCDSVASWLISRRWAGETVGAAESSFVGVYSLDC